MANKQPSDIVELLRRLAWGNPAKDDLALYAPGQVLQFGTAMAERGEPILNVCYEVIELLAKERAHYAKLAIDIVARQPMAPIFIAKDKLG